MIAAEDDIPQTLQIPATELRQLDRIDVPGTTIQSTQSVFEPENIFLSVS